jgi:hypothetical protein
MILRINIKYLVLVFSLHFKPLTRHRDTQYVDLKSCILYSLSATALVVEFV